MLNGYFSGDGTVSKDIKRRHITCSSTSEKMIDGIIILLNRFGIISKKSIPSLVKTNNRGSKNIKQMYCLSIRNNNIKRFHENISLILDYKQKNLNKLIEYKSNKIHGTYDIIPGNNFEQFEGSIHRDEIEVLIKNNICKHRKNKYLKICIDDTEKIYLQKILDSNVYHDDIIKIEIVKPSHKYVYDLTVKDTKNFVAYTAICLRDTFHHAGVGAKGSTTLGVPRINEILGCSKKMKTPMMTIYLEKEHRHDKEMANKIASSIENVKMINIRNKVDVYYDPNPKGKDSIMKKDNVYNLFSSKKQSKYSCQSSISELPWLVRIELNKEMMLEKDINMMDIKVSFCDQWERRFDNMRGIKKEKKALLQQIGYCAILSNNDNDRVPVIHIRFSMTKTDYSIITNFVDMFIDKIKLKGIEGINKIESVFSERLLNYDNEDKKVVEDEQYVIYTSGINLTDICYINGIDINEVVCNDIVKVYKHFGIDAARTILLKELKTVFDTAGNTINYQHLSILVDIMTNTGLLTTIDRNGLNVLDTDVLARASFERPVDQLLNAATFNEVDKMESVSSRIMTGQVINGGTGLCNIMLDIDLLERSEYIEDIDEKYQKTFNEISSDTIMSDILSKDVTDVFIPE
uniref:DNA-directed RNA polymerase n=1 Tax=Mimivirus LCMiAC02 TaxID=2506609 RepID=A0A4D5XF14_9VIRU|nr:MAG: RNA polymerase Rpb1, domain 5 [Mimivirus LCMiAC02]